VYSPVDLPALAFRLTIQGPNGRKQRHVRDATSAALDLQFLWQQTGHHPHVAQWTFGPCSLDCGRAMDFEIVVQRGQKRLR